MNVSAKLHRTNNKARRAGNSPWLDRAARVGLAGRGVLYLTVAGLAVGIARGRSGQSADKKGAVRTLAGSLPGKSLLVVLVVGFAGLALWQATVAAWGRRYEPDDRKRATKRAASAGKALLYAALAASTTSVLVGGGGSSGGGRPERTWTARVLALPAGRVLVGAAGLAVIGAGGWLVVRAVRCRFEKHLDMAAMPAPLDRAATTAGLVGHSARGVVAGLAGLLLVKAALAFDPDKAQGLDGTLRTLADRPYGRLLLLLAAAGLAAFGLFCLVEARYRRL